MYNYEKPKLQIALTVDLNSTQFFLVFIPPLKG